MTRVLVWTCDGPGPERRLREAPQTEAGNINRRSSDAAAGQCKNRSQRVNVCNTKNASRYSHGDCPAVAHTPIKLTELNNAKWESL